MLLNVLLPGCFFFCKDTNFLANHNCFADSPLRGAGCFFFCKDTNFLANHNVLSLMLLSLKVVSSFAKILIF